jgi:predicted transcriptional regulator
LEVRVGKRPDGALEQDILRVLWSTGEAMMPGEVLGRLDVDLAYTSVSTVLTRLYEKGLVTRDRQGRGFAYRATLSESELAARRMGEVLKSAADRKAVLVGFVGSLTKRDVKALRAMVQEHGP